MKALKKFFKFGILINFSTSIFLTKALSLSNNNEDILLNNSKLSNNTKESRGLVDGNFVISENNGITITDSSGSKIDFEVKGQNSNSIGVGYRGYLMLNEVDNRYYYVGYDGRVIWDSKSITSQIIKSIYIDYNLDLNMFILVYVYRDKSSNKEYLRIEAISESDGSTKVYHQNLYSDIPEFCSDNWDYLTVTRIKNSNGYYILPRVSLNSQSIRAINFFVDYESAFSSSGPNNTQIVKTSNGYKMSSSIQTIRSGQHSTRIISAGAIYVNGIYSLFTIQQWPSATRISMNVYKDSSYVYDTTYKGSYMGAPSDLEMKSQITEIALTPQSNNNNIDYMMIYNSDGDNLIKGTYDFLTGSCNYSLISLNTSYLNFNILSGRLYGNGFFLYGDDLTSGTTHKNKILGIRSDNIYINSTHFAYSSNSHNRNTTRMFDASSAMTNVNDSSSYRNVAVMPKYATGSTVFGDVGLISLDSSDWSNTNSIVMFQGNGTLAYKTKLLNSSITLTGLEDTYARSAIIDDIKNKLITQKKL